MTVRIPRYVVRGVADGLSLPHVASFWTLSDVFCFFQLLLFLSSELSFSCQEWLDQVSEPHD